MGCTASKLDNEDTVRRCKERRNQMKEAIFARHHLAAAHSDYCRSLRVTGSALSAFAAGEPLSVSDHTPPVFLRTPNAAAATTVKIPTPPRMPSSSPSLHPQHPPPPFPPSPSPTVASTKHPHILSASSLPPSRHQQRRKPMKLPHILSDSSISSSPQSHRNPNLPNYTYDARPTYSSTPSQASSVWNWENFLPPSPPDSEFFRYRKDNCDDEKASAYSASTHKHYEVNNRQAQAHRNHLDTDEEETEREEVQCSDWGDHDSTTSSSDDEGLDAESRSEGGTRSDFGSSVNNEPKSAPAPAATDSKFSTFRKSDNPHDAGSSVSWNAGSGVISDKKIMVRHKDLAEMVTAIKEYFDKAASAGEQVLEMLETGPAQLNRSFRQLKKTVYHSSGVFSKLRSTWTSKPPLAVKYRFEPGSIEKEPGDTKSLCSTLERLLAWEKKLYQEVKAREGAKIEHEKKLSRLQSQEYKGINEGKLDKTKTAIKRLQSLIVVTSQAASTTSNAIIGIRDTELVPELVELCHGFRYMWRSMNEYHEAQNDIVQQVRGLINQSTKGESTTDIHRQSTRDLEAAVAAWQSSFCRLINFQRDFIRSLHAWFKLTLLPVDNSSGPTTPGKIEISEAFSFLDEWKLALDRLPDTVASEAVKSFVNVIHSISLKQIDEMKIKKRTESASRDLETKSSALRKIEKKYYQSYSTVGIGVPDTEPDDGHVLDTRDPLAEKKMEIAAYRRRLEEEVVRHSKAVEVTRAMTVNNIQTGLPGVFQALTSFSGLLMEALEVVCSRSYAIK